MNKYGYNGCEDNADAHLKHSVMGREVVAAVTDGKFDFGTWKRIFRRYTLQADIDEDYRGVKVRVGYVIKRQTNLPQLRAKDGTAVHRLKALQMRDELDKRHRLL
jgi:hypothetical protein